MRSGRRQLCLAVSEAAAVVSEMWRLGGRYGPTRRINSTADGRGGRSLQRSHQVVRGKQAEINVVVCGVSDVGCWAERIDTRTYPVERGPKTSPGITGGSRGDCCCSCRHV